MKKKFIMKISSVHIYIGILAFILLASLFAPLISPYNPLDMDLDKMLLKPSSTHLLGTDDMGRDLLSRIIYGGRQSIVLAFIATTLAALIGSTIGIIAGYYGGYADIIITACSSIFQGIPGTTILIALPAVLGPGIKGILIALVITSWIGFSRIMRGEVMRVKHEYYVAAAKSLGAGDLRVIVQHILPNALEGIIILFTNKIGNILLSVAALNYLGFGLQPPYPDWGIMIKESRTFFRSSPLLVIAPGICITLFVMSIHAIGNSLRDKFDVQSQSVASSLKE